MLIQLVATITLGMLVLVGSPAYAGVDPGDLCKEKKAKAAGKKASDLLKAFGKNQKKPNISKLAFDISKAQSKFTKGFTKAESGGLCPTSGDSDAIEATVDALVEDVIRNINRWVDNGDGTITDIQTGLMWEKKDPDDDYTPNPANLHDVDNEYSWAGCCDGDCGSYPDYLGLCQPNTAAAAACSGQTGGAHGCSECSVGTCDVDPYGWGAITTIWDWLVQVKAEGGSGFAGHSDWRIPEVNQDGGAEELETILLAPHQCATWACIDPIFGYPSYWCWSGSTNSSNPSNAWYVNFISGYPVPREKYIEIPVRAVRGPVVSSPSAAFLDMTSGVLD